MKITGIAMSQVWEFCLIFILFIFFAVFIIIGTPFMARLCEGLRHYIHDRKTNNPGWKDLIVILSDPQAPGEVRTNF